MKIKALTLWQPWASFMALGLKRNETRSWSTSYRGPLAIHSAAKIPPPINFSFDVLRLAARKLGEWSDWPLGKILCVVDLTEILPTYACPIRDSMERMLGDYSKGRYAWHTTMLQVFDEPIPAKGHQGLWDWEWDKGEK